MILDCLKSPTGELAMEIERQTQQPLSDEDLQQLEMLKDLLKRSVADGVITTTELDAIKVQITADGKVLFEEVELARQFIRAKVKADECVVDFFDRL
jgi:hypothetical protein